MWRNKSLHTSWHVIETIFAGVLESLESLLLDRVNSLNDVAEQRSKQRKIKRCRIHTLFPLNPKTILAFRTSNFLAFFLAF